MSGHRLAHDQLMSESAGSHAESVTATSDGLTTGLIPATARFVTASSSDANHIITLPTPVTGHQLWIQADASTNCELRTPADSGNTINNVDSDGTNECLVTAANSLHCLATSSTSWIVMRWTNVAEAATRITPD
jgi:hypothetical protein